MIPLLFPRKKKVCETNKKTKTMHSFLWQVCRGWVTIFITNMSGFLLKGFFEVNVLETKFSDSFFLVNSLLFLAFKSQLPAFNGQLPVISFSPSHSFGWEWLKLEQETLSFHPIIIILSDNTLFHILLLFLFPGQLWYACVIYGFQFECLSAPKFSHAMNNHEKCAW